MLSYVYSLAPLPPVLTSTPASTLQVATKEAEKAAALAAKEGLVAAIQGDARDSKRAANDLERDADVEAQVITRLQGE